MNYGELLYKYMEEDGVNPDLLREAISSQEEEFIWKALSICKTYCKNFHGEKETIYREKEIIESYVNAIVWCLGSINCQTDSMIVDELVELLEIIVDRSVDKGIVNSNIRHALECLHSESGDENLAKVVNCLCKYYSKRITLYKLAKILSNFSDEENENLLGLFNSSYQERIEGLIKDRREDK